MNEDTEDASTPSIPGTGSQQDVWRANESRLRPDEWYAQGPNTNNSSVTFTSDANTQDDGLWALYRGLQGRLRAIESQARTTRSLLQKLSEDTFWDQGVEVVAVPLGTIREIETHLARILEK